MRHRKILLSTEKLSIHRKVIDSFYFSETVSGDGDGSINHVLAEQNSHAPEKNSPAGEESSPKQDISLEGTSPQNSEDCSV